MDRPVIFTMDRINGGRAPVFLERILDIFILEDFFGNNEIKGSIGKVSGMKF